MVTSVGCVTVAVTVEVHPLASVIVRVYDPAESEEAEPVTLTAGADHTYV
jgi:hypothetical protein